MRSVIGFAAACGLVATACAHTDDAASDRPPAHEAVAGHTGRAQRPSLGPGRLYGRVTRPDGGPARDAVVTILAPMGPYVAAPYSVHADEEGTFDLGVRPSANWWLRVEAASTATKCIYTEVGDDPVVVALSPSRTIRGRVIKSDGSIAFPRTIYFDVAGQERRPATIVARGSFEIRNVGDETGTLVALVRAHSKISPGSQRVARIERLTPSDESVELVFGGGLTISGVLTDDHGNPVRRVGVQAIAEPLSDDVAWLGADHCAASTRDTGEFSIRGLPPGRYALRPWHPDGHGGTGPARWWDGADGIEAGRTGVKVVERIGRRPESK